ncbi:hypothetical protein C2G38_2029285 [Gigaspora rosea]|uniref:Uncharacterized protein n=1 Tax=Gigaspora rosea TaxID=44941 RepID=A0A397W2P9_9GLOM|nr:hypothetical protein C2G38_2029285 [Gigaspora rosea]
MSLYRMNKQKFYYKAALYLGNGKTGDQIYRNNSQKDNGNDKNKSLKSNKKRRLDEEEMHYIKSIDMITQKKEKLQFEKEKWEHEKNEKIILEKYKLELEYKLQLELKTRELELKFKNEAVMENEL